MRHHSEKICAAGIILQIIFALMCFGMSGWNKSSATYATGWLFLLGTVFWFLCYIHLWAMRAAEEEEREEKDFERRRGAKETEKLFEERKETEDAFSSRTKLRRLERWFFPAVSLLYGIGAALFSYMLLTGRIGSFAYGALDKELPSIAFLGGIAFFSFIFSRYTAGLSEESRSQSLRTCSGAMFSGTVSAFLIAISFIASSFGYPMMERVMLYVVSALIGVVGIEIFLTFITHFYRPRVKGRVTTPVYYSRILGLIAMPKSIFRATALTLDYQFGFKVSETWFYQFFERAAAPLVLYLLLSLYLFSSVVVVQSDEEVIVERFGRPLRPALGPGIHLKLPWPFERAYRYSKWEVKEMIIGIKPEKEPHKVLVWIRPHHEEEFHFIVAQKEKVTRSEVEGVDDVDPAVAINFLAINIRLQYRIKDVFDYAYNKSDPEHMLEDLAYRELVKYCATVDYNKFMGEGRGGTEQATMDNVGAAIDAERLGIELLSVNILNVHPPIPTVEAFEAVVGALEEKEARIWEAKGEANEILNKVAGSSRKALMGAVRDYDAAAEARDEALASGDGQAMKEAEEALRAAEAKVGGYLLEAGGSVSEEIQKSDSERYRLEELTRADSESFKIKAAAFNIGPEIYKLRFRLQTMAESMVNSRKYIVPADSKNTEVFILNLEQKAPSILDTYKTETEK